MALDIVSFLDHIMRDEIEKGRCPGTNEPPNPIQNQDDDDHDREPDALQELYDIVQTPSYEFRSPTLTHHMRAMKAVQTMLNQRALIGERIREEVKRVNEEMVIR